LDSKRKDSLLRAIFVLGEIGSEASEAVPKLIELLAADDRDVHTQAKKALCRIGAVAVIALESAIRNGSYNVRLRAAYVLGEIGPNAVGSVPGLINMLADPDTGLHQQAERALRRIGPDAVPKIEKSLVSKEFNIRLRAAYVLGEIGPGAMSSVPALLKLLEGGDERQQVANALAKIDPTGRLTLPKFNELLVAADPSIRQFAANALRSLGPAAIGSVPVLIRLLSDPDREACKAGIGAMERINPKSPALVPALIDLLSDPFLAESAARALGNVAAATSPTLDALRAVSDDMNQFEETRAAASEAMIKLIATNGKVLPVNDHFLPPLSDSVDDMLDVGRPLAR